MTSAANSKQQTKLISTNNVNHACYLLRNNCCLAFVIVACLLTSSPCWSDRQTYKWRTDSGTVRYSDVMPAEEVDKQQTVLDSKGLPIREIERSKTQKELAEEKKQRLLAEQQRKQREQQARANQFLLKSYRTENDLIRAQNTKIKSVEQSIELNQDSLTLHKNKINQLRKTVANYERTGQKVPRRLITQIQEIRKIIKTTAQSILNKRKQQQKIRLHYQQLLIHYRKIKAQTTTQTSIK